MGRNKRKHKSNRYINDSDDSSSSESSVSQSSYSSKSSSDSEMSIQYRKDKSKQRRNYRNQTKKLTRDIEDDYNLPQQQSRRIKTLILQSKRNQGSRETVRSNAKSMKLIPQEDEDNQRGSIVPANTRRMNNHEIQANNNYYQQDDMYNTETRTKSKSQNLDAILKQQMLQEQYEDQNNLMDPMQYLKKKPNRRQSQRNIQLSGNSLFSNKGQGQNNLQVIQNSNMLTSPAIQSPSNQIISPQNFNSNHILQMNNNTQQQHHISNFARIQPINNSMNSSVNATVMNNTNIQNQDSRLIKDSQDLQKLEIKNKELNRIQNQQKQALKSLQFNLKRSRTQDNIDLQNTQKDKQNNQKKKRILYTIIYIKKLWSQLVKYIQYQHFLSSFVYQITNEHGLKSLFHFKFLTTCINFYLFGTLLFLYPDIIQLIYRLIHLIFLLIFYIIYSYLLFSLIIKIYPDFLLKKIIQQIINYNDLFSDDGIQIFYLSNISNKNGIFAYFNLIIILIAFVLINMAYYGYMHFKKNSIVFETQKAKGLKYFTMIFCEYNWKLPGAKPRQLFQLSLAKKVFSSLQEEDQIYRRSTYLNINKQIIKSILFYIIFLGTLGCSGYFMIILNNNQIFEQRITKFLFLHECIQSIIVILFIEICGLILNICKKCLLHYEKRDGEEKAESAKNFIYQALAYSLYIFIRSSITYTDEKVLSNIIENNYKNNGYECPQQSTAHGLLSLYLMHMLFIIYLKQYLKIIFKNCIESECHLNPDLECVSNNKHRSQFKIIENTIPIIISNMIVLMNTPYNFAIYPISLVLTFIYFIHNIILIKQQKLPEYLTMSTTTIHEMIIKMFLFSLFLNFIHFFFISTLDQPLFYFTNDVSRICGPFSESETSILSYTFSYLLSQDGFQQFLDIIFWRPLLVSIIIFFILKSITDSKSYQKWLSVLRSRSKELNAVKKHYKKKVNKLQKQLDDAQRNLKAIQSTNGAPQIIKQEKKLSSNENLLATAEDQKYQMIQTLESPRFQGGQNNSFQNQRKRSTFINLTTEGNEIQQIITKPDSDFI